jgi:hypothetical protein
MGRRCGRRNGSQRRYRVKKLLEHGWSPVLSNIGSQMVDPAAADADQRRCGKVWLSQASNDIEPRRGWLPGVRDLSFSTAPK